MEYSVLVVDDSPDNIKYITSLLKDLGLRKKIYSAPNGKVALQLAEKFLPNLIISDWEMPVMNGLELLKSLKRSTVTKDIPFIMVTAIKIESSFLKESFDAGVHDYLKKPFNDLEFKARISATLKLNQAFNTIKRSKEEIASQAQLIAEQNKELKRLNSLKDKILSIISHDMRSPLSTLEGLIKILGLSELNIDKSYHQYFKKVELKIHNITSFLNNLLFWSRSQLENNEIEKSKVSLKEIVSEISSLLNEKLEMKDIQFVDLINPKMEAFGNRNAISFVLKNLIENAIKFTPKSGQISIDFKNLAKNQIITVSDSGTGIDPETLSNLFSNNIRTTNKGTEGELGTGLGLKLCKDFAEQQGGDIKIKSEVGKGSAISLVLPN